METSLQGTMTASQLQTLEATHGMETEEEQHIHLPNPSLWPLLLSAAIVVTVVGLFFIPDNPWLTIIGAPFVLLTMMGWALEDPMASLDHEQSTGYEYVKPLSEQELLDRSQEIAESTVTVGSTAYSTHPVRIESEGNGVLALYGKVELEAQSQELEQKVRALPGVSKVQNFIVAEDTILGNATARIDNLRSRGKLEGAQNIDVLVENYILHLYGEVPDRDMKYALERELIGIPGVKVIVNHIGLNKNVPGNLGKTRNR